jgi:hypothetical protein
MRLEREHHPVIDFSPTGEASPAMSGGTGRGRRQMRSVGPREQGGTKCRGPLLSGQSSADDIRFCLTVIDTYRGLGKLVAAMEKEKPAAIILRVRGRIKAKPGPYSTSVKLDSISLVEAELVGEPIILKKPEANKYALEGQALSGYPCA